MTTDSYSIKLSPYHKIFYNEWKLDPDSSKYNIVFDQTLSNNLDINRLRNALDRVIADYLILNSHIIEIDNEPYWVLNNMINHLEYYNDIYTYEQIFEYASRPFNINSGPLYRFAIFRQTNGNFRFICVWHHLLMDGSSVDISISEISNYYNSNTYKMGLTSNQQLNLIKNTTELFNAQINKNLDNSKKFWNKKLLDIEGPDLRFLKLNKILDRYPSINLIKEIRFSIPSKQTLKTKHILRQYQLTTYLYSRCIFAILLYCYTSQNKFAFSYPIAIPGGVDFVCGVKVNTNIIPFIFSDATSIIDLIDQNKQFIKSLKSYENFNNGYCPIDVIISGKNKNLLEVCFAQTNLKDTLLKFEGVKTLSVNHEFNIDFEDGLFFEQEAKNGIINFRVRYNKLETDEFILTNFIKQYIKLFFDILNDLEQKILNKPIITYNLLEIEEYNKIIYKHNNNYSFFTTRKTLHELFEKQVNLHPNNIALIFQNIKLNYNELNNKSNRLAHYLRKTYQIKSDDLIAICLDKSENNIISMLGILKAGGAYVPIDPDYPLDRIKYILLDTKAKVVLSQSKYKTKLLNIESIFNTEYMDSQEFQKRLIDMPVINPIGISHSSNLCYVIYTSGTTGNPKGVLQQHDNVLRLFVATKKWFDFGIKDIWLFFHSCVFDFSVWEIWGALLHGGKLVIPRNEDVKDFFNLYKLCKKEEITILNQTPTAFYQFSEIATKYPLLEHLRYVIFGGEKLNIPQLKSWFNHYKNKAKLINMYGITETTVHVTYKLIEANQLFHNSLIGNVIPDQKAYILNKHQQVLPIGAIGELYVGGAGLARGYLNKIKLTQEKFILNPFQTSSEKMANINSRLYRSGDLARMLPNGELEYMGRIDHQVKIRGYRIELGEIETVLNNYPGINQSVVLVKERKSINIIDNYLIAYYVSSKKLDIQKINEYLNNYLPMYVIPSYIIHINKLPLTINGKLDKGALPNPETTIKKEEYIVPKNEIEQQICQSFADILHLPVEKIGANHDFFQIGGNSILAIHLTSKLQNNFKINVNDIFSLKTPIKIALTVKTTNNGIYENLKKLEELYYHLNNYKYTDKIKAEQKKIKYLESIDKFIPQLKPINNILLTGATGYLGCHILFTLLTTTKYNIYLLIRGQSIEHAKHKIYQKFLFYFSIDLDQFERRLFILLSDIEEPYLNLNIETYNKLSKTVDSIIHAAALTKHYGEYKKFYSANVQATINMLNFAKLTKFKDFHYISTISVLDFGYIPNCSYYIFHEDELNILQDQENFYVTSKYKAELEVMKYREFGINASIYRLGNLSINSKTYKNQENIEDNAFFIKIKTFLNLRLIPQELRYVEISPVDYVALGIVKLFNQTNLINQTYHLFNPNLNDLLKLFSHYKKIKITIIPFREFIDVISKYLNQNFDNEQIGLFVLHQGWLQNINLNQITKIEILQDKTNTILDQLGFKWPEISSKMMTDLVEKSFNKADRMIEDDNIFKHLDYTCDKFPANFYWFDPKGVILGLNQKVVSSIGAIQKEDVIGKTLYDIYPQDIANDLLIHIKDVIANKKEIEREHKIKDITTGKYRYYLDTMSPITNAKGIIIGIAGSSFEISAEKEVENLKNENEKHQIEAEQQQRFREVVGQVNHDIKSPIASLQMLTKQCSHLLPENERNSYNKAIMQITDIANNMMNYFKPKNKWEDILKLETNSSLLVSTELLEVLAEKKYEYIKNPISFTHNFSQIGNFAFININARTFERMISNVINNAVDALEDNGGIVHIKLDIKDNLVEIIIEDNGKGIPDKIKNKIMNNEAISAGKKDGHGIGLTQVRQVLEKNGGKLNIESELGVGTKIILTFPKAVAPNWMAERIKIEKDNLVVIVDDDPSIHGAWDSRFKVEAREVIIKHFEIGEEAVDYLNNLSDVERQKVLLLIDYQLLKQPLNGLDVINKSNIKNAILVTNYYANLEVCEAAGKENIKILPKALSVNIPIIFREKIISNSKKVDMVWVDDAREFINNLITKYYSHLKVDFFYDPADFLKDVEQYPLDTKIILDGFYCDDSGFTIIADGITIAKKLHVLGYNNLYLTSSEDIPQQVLPSYVTFISKHDTENMVILDKLQK